LTWLDKTRLVHFTETEQSIAHTIEYAKGAARPAASPALLVISDGCFHGGWRAPPAAYPLRHLFIFTGEVVGGILRVQRSEENYFIRQLWDVKQIHPQLTFPVSHFQVAQPDSTETTLGPNDKIAYVFIWIGHFSEKSLDT
jgi:hypothetical protein